MPSAFSALSAVKKAVLCVLCLLCGDFRLAWRRSEAWPRSWDLAFVDRLQRHDFQLSCLRGQSQDCRLAHSFSNQRQPDW
jgi:hypothetical protein